MLTARQAQVLSYIDNHLTSTGTCPSYEEMLEAAGLRSKSGIHRIVRALERRGYIRRLPAAHRAIEVLKLPENTKAAAVRAAVGDLLNLIERFPDASSAGAIAQLRGCAIQVRNAMAEVRA